MNIPLQKIDQLVELVRSRFPQWATFSDPAFEADEVTYKQATIKKARELLSPGELQRLIDESDYDEVIARLDKLGKDNNLLFLRIPLEGDLQMLYQKNLGRAKFCKAFQNLIYGKDPIEARFNAWVSFVDKEDLPNYWTFPTYFLFLFHPESEIFVKPRTTKWLLEFLGIDAAIGRPASWPFYSMIREVAAALREGLKAYGPRDLVDIQSIIWVCASQKDTNLADLAEAKGTQDLTEGPKPQADASYWKIAPGDDAWQWSECRDKGFIAVGWDEIGDLSSVTRAEFEALRDALIKKHLDWKKRGLEQLWKFIGIQEGDRIVANRGTTEVLGIGTITGPYSFVPDVDYGHRFPVHWDDLTHRQVNQGGWRRTLIELDQQGFEAICNAPPVTTTADQDKQHQPAVSTTSGYWWLNANPKIWDFRSNRVGAHQTYTSHNDKGNKRRIYEYFQAVKPGDLLLGYITSPDKEIVALCRITKPLHTDPKEGEVFEFEKIEQLKKPVSWSELQSIPVLANCEPLLNNQGSLFRLTKAEFDMIRKVTEAPESDDTPQVPLSPFTEADALQDLFIDKPEQLKVILSRLRRKKALILQGPPGVGKTFFARRIAYALMGCKDDPRVHMVQFHPSYGYEDFVQGYRPTRAGSLERRDGVFYEFARSARNDPRSTWVFIIDEINRGNLAKIFGELLMLLEADKRGPKNSVSLTYSEKDEEFYLPENLFVIGTMNTADRSLAMVDYALRRRFAFATLGPALDTDAFATWFLQKGASKELLHRIRTGIGKLNSEIIKERDLGEGFCIGHSFFCPTENEKPDDSWYSEIIDSEIKPLLKEYFESPDRVDTLIKDLL